MIEIGDATIGMWCVSLPAGDWLAHLGRLQDGHTFELVFRFRWYRDDKVFDSADEKSWTRMRSKPGDTEATAIAMARFAYQELIDRTGSGRHWELMRGARSAVEFAQLLRSMPGMASKQV